MPRARSVLLLLLCSLPSSCVLAIGTDHDSDWCWSGENAIQGSGVAATQAREVEEFTEIEISCGGDVDMRIGSERSVHVTCDDNLLQYVRTEVKNGALQIGLKRGAYDFKRDLHVEVTTPALEGLQISGSSDVDIAGLAGPRFAIAISGSGDVRASGAVERLDVSISGSGDLDLYELVAQEAHVSISGSGDVELTAMKSLDAEVSGSGDIRYHGQPETKLDVSGSGSIERE